MLFKHTRIIIVDTSMTQSVPEKHAATNTYSKQGPPISTIWSLNHRYVLYCAYLPSSAARCFKYSSKEGAAEMDLRGSSSSLASGLRVSAIPPAPMCWPMAVDRVIWVEGAKAEAEATRAAMTASLYCK